MSSDAKPASWLGRVVSTEPELLVQDLFLPDRAPIVAEHDGPSPAVGSFVWMEGERRYAPSARLADVLAEPGTARADVYALAVDHGLDPAFRPEVLAEVDALLADPCIDDPALQDLRSLPFVTVDDEHTRDLDQALFVERTEAGYRVWYALADASFYVRPGMAVFEEGLRRGASYYLPGVVVPMLPRPLSEHLISLNEGVDRRATVFRTELDASGVARETRMVRGRIRSQGKLSFAGVQAFYDDPSGSELRHAAYAESLALLREVGLLRMTDAEHRDVVRYRRTEVDVGLEGESGLRFVVVDDLRRDVERYNEQLSLLCNIEGARLLYRGDPASEKVQPIYRVHPRPSRERMEEFEAMLRSLARAHGLEASAWTWSKGCGRSLNAFLMSLPSEGEHAAVARAIHRQAVMLNLRSSFSVQPGEHYGVGAELYARFSSPMREIVGVFVHKEAWEKSDGSLPARWTSSDPAEVNDDELRARVVEQANGAKELQKVIDKDANLLVLDRLFSQDVALPEEQRPTRTGTIMGLTRSKLHVLLEEPRLDVKVYAEHFARARGSKVHLSDDGATWVDDAGDVMCRLGDVVTIRVLSRETARKRWELGTLE